MPAFAETVECDLLIVGGGINGVGIARDAAGRGLSVVLCDKDDLAAHTSSASTKLVHGGLRYLEHFEFGLVRKALREREVLLRAAPHIMWPLRFVMPHDRHQRPAWLLRAGLYLYDHLAKRELLGPSRAIDLRRHPAGAPLKNTFARAFEYADGWVDDARLVVLNAVDAAEKGARILTHTRCESAQRDGDYWHALLRDAEDNPLQVSARCLVNAAGPWAAQFLQSVLPQSTHRSLHLIKGSHIVVPRLFDHPYAYIFQHSDQRIVFAIPYEDAFTLIGTTDIAYHDSPDNVAIDSAEIDYLCSLTSHYFARPIRPADVVWSYSGVRPLVEDTPSDAAKRSTSDSATRAAAITRDYRLQLERPGDGAPLLSVFGGKITTYRKLAEEAMTLLQSALPACGPAWTAAACLPGGDLFGPTPSNRAVQEFDLFVAQMQARYTWLAPALVRRYVRAYGTRIAVLLAGRRNVEQMGVEIVAGLYAAEATYLMRHEWASCAVDILWRRSKLGLQVGSAGVAALDTWIASQRQGDRSA